MKNNINLMMGSLGNGTTCVDRNREEHGDYKKIAHISEYGKVTLYDKKLPAGIIEKIEAEAKRLNIKHYASVKAEALYKAKQHNKDVWIYQYGLTFGFRFGKLPEKEEGKFIARFTPDGFRIPFETDRDAINFLKNNNHSGEVETFKDEPELLFNLALEIYSNINS